PHRLPGLRLRQGPGTVLSGEPLARGAAADVQAMGPIEVVALRPAWRRLAPRCVRLLGRLRRATGKSAAGVTLLLAPDREVRRLNRSFRGKDRTTDVL